MRAIRSSSSNDGSKTPAQCSRRAYGMGGASAGLPGATGSNHRVKSSPGQRRRDSRQCFRYDRLPSRLGRMETRALQSVSRYRVSRDDDGRRTERIADRGCRTISEPVFGDLNISSEDCSQLSSFRLSELQGPRRELSRRLGARRVKNEGIIGATVVATGRLNIRVVNGRHPGV